MIPLLLVATLKAFAGKDCAADPALVRAVESGLQALGRQVPRPLHIRLTIREEGHEPRAKPTELLTVTGVLDGMGASISGLKQRTCGQEEAADAARRLLSSLTAGFAEIRRIEEVLISADGNGGTPLSTGFPLASFDVLDLTVDLDGDLRRVRVTWPENTGTVQITLVPGALDIAPAAHELGHVVFADVVTGGAGTATGLEHEDARALEESLADLMGVSAACAVDPGCSTKLGHVVDGGEHRTAIRDVLRPWEEGQVSHLDLLTKPEPHARSGPPSRAMMLLVRGDALRWTGPGHVGPAGVSSQQAISAVLTSVADALARPGRSGSASEPTFSTLHTDLMERLEALGADEEHVRGAMCEVGASCDMKFCDAGDGLYVSPCEVDLGEISAGASASSTIRFVDLPGSGADVSVEPSMEGSLVLAGTRTAVAFGAGESDAWSFSAMPIGATAGPVVGALRIGQRDVPVTACVLPFAQVGDTSGSYRARFRFHTSQHDVGTLNANVLQELESWLAGVDVNTARVELTGHADVRGSDPYNDRLSCQRAASVAAWLTGRGLRLPSLNACDERPGVRSSENARVRWAGRREPLELGYDAAAHEANRRVDLVISGSQAPRFIADACDRP